MRLCRFNDAGIAAFRQYIGDLRAGNAGPALSSILTAPAYTEIMELELPDVCPVFQTKIEIVSWLEERFETTGFHPDERNVGLWTWLAAYIFESICPVRENGKRKVLADPHYVLDVLNHQRTYRHLVVAPWRVFIAAREHSALFLNEKPYIHGELMEQGMSRLYLMRISAVAEVMELLYFDHERGRARQGIMPKVPKRGDFRNRFPRRIQQLMLTYDLMSTDAKQLLALLGPEFGQGPN